MKPLVILTVYNRRDETMRTLAALEETTDFEDIELVVVDNGSTDGAVAELESWVKEHPDAWHGVLLLEKNVGCPRALNYALNYRQPEQPVVKLDNDVAILTPGWVGLFERFMEATPQVAMCGPWYDELVEEGRLKEKAFQAIEYYVVYPLIGHMAWHAGWFMDRVGYFDVLAPDHLYGFEDLLMCQKAAALGYEMAVLPSVRVEMIQRKSALDVAGPESREEHVRRLRPEYERRAAMVGGGEYILTDENGQPILK